MISRPVVVSPVNAILAIRLLDASGLPASTPKPLTTLSTPGGQQITDQRHQVQDRRRGLLGRLEHHRVTRRPAPGASFHTAIRIGKFHGMIWPTTPSGSWK